MATPFKMKGHTLPGINQRLEGDTDSPDGRSKSSAFQKQSPMKEPLTAMLIGTALSAGIGGASKAISNKNAMKKELEGNARNKSNDLSSSMSGDIGSKTKITD